MSVQKLHTIKRAQKDQGKCQNCGVALLKGEGYRWWTMGFRAKHKNKVCLKPECTPSPSSRETSKFATILAAQENFATAIDDCADAESVSAAVDEVAHAVEEVASEYQDALDQWENGNEMLQEKVDHYESQMSELESFDPIGSEPEKEDFEDEEDPEEAFNEAIEEWLENIKNEARDAVDSIEAA